MNVQQMIDIARSQYPWDAMTKLQEEWGYDEKGFTKFFNHDRQFPACAERIEYFGLNNPAPPALRIVDIGPALGHYPHILKCLGHDIATVEVPDYKLYATAVRTLGIPVVEEFVRANKPLPGDFHDLDFVSMSGINFDISESPDAAFNGDIPLWTLKEWQFFLDDILRRLKPHGRIGIGFNFNWPCGKSRTQVWLLEQQGFVHWLRHHELVSGFKIDIPRMIITRNEKTV